MPISQAEVCSQRGRTYISNIDEALAHHHVRVRRSNYQQAEIKKFLGAIRTPAAARSMSTPGIEQAQQRLGRASGRAWHGRRSRTNALLRRRKICVPAALWRRWCVVTANRGDEEPWPSCRAVKNKNNRSDSNS
jgi:hypothetical protein